ncbi:hypothetical protein PVK06_008179 [Gossypium arboreum]|uniref:Uncharacterized protein n=1 Tax=Gossypium arboreum TaxID=29729 RepID=A0ABR0QJG9_GOSAR|nr:hypothetical protein PVK06_008179 [Gossypium arboreum]
MPIGYIAHCMGLIGVEMMIFDLFLFIEYTKVQHLLRTIMLYCSDSGVFLGVDVKPSGLALSAEVCFGGMLAYGLGSWCPSVFSDDYVFVDSSG